MARDGERDSGKRDAAQAAAPRSRHGRRRAEEMAEAARTVEETGIAPTMARAIADKQQWVARLAGEGVFDGLSEQDGWRAYSDRLIARTDAVPAQAHGHEGAPLD
ncbi:DUF1932 domain-containing protein [Ralstonia solanacearum]|uniref:DUF1932 domain-containing protein n=1 Tax=Ralstonia solanacearum TaxID=305 RepID=UPI000B2C189E